MSKSFEVKKSIKVLPTSTPTDEVGEIRVASEDANRLQFNNGVVEQRVLLQEDAGTVGFTDASNVVYDPTASGLTATDVQAALDEIDNTVDGTANKALSNLNTNTFINSNLTFQKNGPALIKATNTFSTDSASQLELRGGDTSGTDVNGPISGGGISLATGNNTTTAGTSGAGMVMGNFYPGPTQTGEDGAPILLYAGSSGGKVDANGGTMDILGGGSTGTGHSYVTLYAAVPGAVSGTAENYSEPFLGMEGSLNRNHSYKAFRMDGVSITPANGDLWLDSADGLFKKHENGVTSALGSGDAIDINYDNTVSGLTATDVQAAIDEIVAMPAPVTGANQTLSNLTSPTAINKNLTFGTNGVESIISAPTMANGNQGDIRIRGGDGNTELLYGPQPGGLVTLQSGNADPGSASLGSPATIQLGLVNEAQSGAGLLGSDITIKAGNAGIYTASPGDIPNLRGGVVAISAGASTGSGTSQVTIAAALAGTSGYASSAPVEFFKADGNTGRNVFSQPIVITPYGGAPTSTTNGEIWYDTGLGKLRKKEGGVVTDLDNIGGGSKNYLGNYLGTNHNGDFDAGTVGWSLFNTTLDSNNHPNSSSITAGASSAGGTLTPGGFGTSYPGPILAGTKSLVTQWQNGTGWVAGDGFISDIFYIDQEDQGKPLGISMSYKFTSTLTGMDFSGTSAATIGMYIYDASNNKWIVPAGCFGFVQSNGVGILKGSFQTSLRSPQIGYRIAVVARSTAASASPTVLFDSVFVGPEKAALGVPATDWAPYTPSFANLGTVTGIAMQWRRIADSIEIQGRFTTGSPGSGTPSFTLPAGLSADVSKLTSANPILGRVERGIGATQAWTYYLDILGSNGTPGSVFFSTGNNTGTPGSGITAANSFFGTSEIENVSFLKIPIAGWSSNVNMSSDTDTRVVAADLSSTVATSLAAATDNLIPFNVITRDTHGAYNTTTSLYEVKVTGWYQIESNLETTAVSWGVGNQFSVGLVTNGTSNSRLDSTVAQVAAAYRLAASGSKKVYLNAGDTVGIFARPSVACALEGSAINNWMSISRLSGPATIAASESVNAHYRTDAATSITSSVVLLPFNTRVTDSHLLYNTSTGEFAVNMTGKYRISCKLKTGSASWGAVNQGVQIQVFKNGSLYEIIAEAITQTTGTFSLSPSGSTTVDCVAGDSISIHAYSDVTVILNGVANRNLLSIERVGN